MKAHLGLPPEPFAREDHNRGDPTNHRDVAQQGSVPIADPVHKIARRRRGGSPSRLPGTAFPAELVRVADGIAALHAVRHPVSLYDTLVESVPATACWLPTAC